MSTTAPALVELLSTLESSLDAERDALLNADPESLMSAAAEKLRTLESIDTLCRAQPPAATFKPRLRAAMVANSRNQALLAVLRTRVESRMQSLGLLESIYSRGGRQVTPRFSRSVRL